MAAPTNPAMPGSFAFDPVVYAAAGLGYAAVATLGQFIAFDTPSPGFTTRRVDLSAFADLGRPRPWPFTNADAPLNGEARIPQGIGPFPLAVFAHGNHEPTENSTPGYLYLCDLMASHGVIAATIDVNFLNGGNRGENGGRAILHLEHIHQFALWNATPGHPLHAKVDLTRVMIVGHSRGGEAVGHASLFNRLPEIQPDSSSPPIRLDGSDGLGPYQFSLRAVVAIAPTDGQYVPVTGPTRVSDNYIILHGSRDGDVKTFPGYRTFDLSLAPNLANPLTPAKGHKSLVWVHRANHNYFNSTWDQESPVPTLARTEQEQIARVFIGAVAQAELLGDHSSLEILRDHQTATAWLPSGLVLVTQHQPAHRIYLQHFEEPGPALQVSPPTTGTAAAVGPQATKLLFNLGSDSHLYQETTGLRIDWTTQGSIYTVGLDPDSIPIGVYNFLMVRVGQSAEPNNPPGTAQDFTLVLDNGTGSVSVVASEVQRLEYPDTIPGLPTAAKTVMQTLRVPLSVFPGEGYTPNRPLTITFSFNRTASGTLYLDDLQLCP
jgi:hypothetical protein